MKIKRAFLATSLLALAACGATTVAIAVASVGIAGAGLSTYCVTGGSGCSSGLVSYALFITTQASEDASILESGTATAAQINGVAANLQNALASAPVVGLTPQQQVEVSAIVTSINVLLPLVEQLKPAPVVTITLTSRDRTALDNMQVKITATRTAH